MFKCVQFFSRQLARSQPQRLVPQRTFQTVEQVSRFVETNDLAPEEWMFVIKQLLSLNSKAVMELDHQRTLMEALHASKQPISTEFVTLLCALLAQYRRHKINEPYIALYKPLLIEMLFSASRNFTPRSLIQTLNILNPFTDTNHIQQWDVVVHSTFEEDIELSRLEVQTIHRLLHFCEKQQLDLKSRDRLLRLVERSLSTVIKDLPKPDLLSIVHFCNYKPGLYNAEVLAQFTQRVLALFEQFTFQEVATINRFMNRFGVLEPQWVALQHDRVIEEVPLADLNALVDSLGDTKLNAALHLTLEPYFKFLEGQLLERFNELSINEQLNLLRLHSLLILSVYQQFPLYDASKRSSKNLRQLNNNFYEIVTPQLKAMDFRQTLLFLENASVLGISKRKVCKLVFERGLQGLQQQYAQDQFGLFSYYRLLQHFLVAEDQIIEIEHRFQDMAINTLDLQTQYGHILIKRDRLL